MMSNSQVPARPSRRVILLTNIKRTTMRLGAVTQAFFRKGEELEATGFENVPPDDPTLVPPKLGFRSFDRVPRRWTPILLAVLSIAAVTLGVFEWHSIREAPVRPGGVGDAVRATATDDWDRLKSFVRARAAHGADRTQEARDPSTDRASTAPAR